MSAEDTAETLRAELSALDSTSLKARYDTFIRALRQQNEEREAAFPFNRPDARADFEHWAKMEYWTVDEGVALLFGRSPDVLIWDKVKHYDSPTVRQFARVREVARRAVHWKGLHEGNRPGSFIRWAKRLELPVPQQLEEMVEKFGHFMGDWYSNYTELKKAYDELKAQYESNTAAAKAMYEGIIAQWSKQYSELGAQSKKNVDKAMQMLQERNEKIAALNIEVGRLSNQQQATLKDKPLGQREGDTLRKLVIGLAIVAYRYDPREWQDFWSGLPQRALRTKLVGCSPRWLT